MSIVDRLLGLRVGTAATGQTVAMLGFTVEERARILRVLGARRRSRRRGRGRRR